MQTFEEKMIDLSYEFVNVPKWFKAIPEHLKTQEMCKRAIKVDPYSLGYVRDCFKIQDMCNKAVPKRPNILEYVPDHLKTQEMCIKVIKVDPWQLYDVPDCFNTQEICDTAVRINTADFFYSCPF